MKFLFWLVLSGADWVLTERVFEVRAHGPSRARTLWI